MDIHPTSPVGDNRGKRYLLPIEAAHKLRTSLTTLYEFMKAGGLPYIQLGKSRRIAEEDLDAFIARHEADR